MTTLDPARIADELPAGPGRSATRRRAVAEIGLFLGTVAVLMTASTAIGLHEHVDVSHIDKASPLGQASMYGQALFPFLAALLVRFVLGRRTERPGWGVRRTPWRTIGIAWAYGLGTTSVAGALCWATGVARFDASGFGPIVPLGLTVLALPYVVLAVGEDVGWRGLLVTRLAEVSGPRTVVLVSGLAWAAFHWPLMMFLGGSPHGVPVPFALLSFTIASIALGAVFANMQLRWGLWPAVVAHAAENAALYHVFAPLTGERAHSGWFVGEVGVFAALVLTVGALAWWRVAPLVRTPEGGTAPARRR